MKFSKYKIILLCIAATFTSTIQAQKHEKKFTEKFSVNKDVEIAIDAVNTDIDVTTWNKNEVLVEAFIEVEGISKQEAEKYLKNWDFEALGNKSKVQIKAKGNNFYGLDDSFVIFDSNNFKFPDIVLPELESFSFDFPDFETTEIPDFDFETMFSGLENLEFDFEKYAEDGENYFFQWKDDAHDISIKSKKEWEEFKKTKEYKELKEKMKKAKEKFKNKFSKIKPGKHHLSKEKLEKALAKAKIEFEKVDKKKIKEELARVSEKFKSMKFDHFFDSDSKYVTVDGKKVKIKKRIVIKVPQGATFDLNTRHCKVTLPKTKASGKVSYGAFNASELNGGDLKISYSPVTIDLLNDYILSLNYVTDAQIASVTNTRLSTNSSDVKIQNINQNVDLTNKFGKLKIANVNPNYQSFYVLLNYSDAIIDFSRLNEKFSFDVKDKKYSFGNKSSMRFNENGSYVQGNFVVNSKSGTIKIDGKFSELKIK